jgi:hypothetical protein
MLDVPPSSSLADSLQLAKKGLRDLGFLSKIALLRVGGFDLKSFGGELVEGKKMVFQAFNGSFNG